jgi:hypothetical protein
MTETESTLTLLGDEEIAFQSFECLTLCMSLRVSLGILFLAATGLAVLLSTRFTVLSRRSSQLFHFIGSLLMCPLFILFYQLYASVLPQFYKFSELTEDGADIGA